MNKELHKWAPGLLNTLAWDESQGDVPFHYRNKPAGHRCLWTASWAIVQERKPTSVTTIQAWYPAFAVENMTDEQMRCELWDVAARLGFFSWQALQLLLDEKTDRRFNDPTFFARQADGILREARLSYPEYRIAWNEPTNSRQRNIRPGWEKETEELIFRLNEAGG